MGTIQWHEVKGQKLPQRMKLIAITMYNTTDANKKQTSLYEKI